MDISNLNSATQFSALGLIMEKANEVGYTIGDDTIIGYNENSGYIYAYDENEMYTLAITDFGYNRGEGVEFIISCYVNGDEFIGDSLEEAVSEYNDDVKDAIESGDLDEDEVLMFD